MTLIAQSKAEKRGTLLLLSSFGHPVLLTQINFHGWLNLCNGKFVQNLIATVQERDNPRGEEAGAADLRDDRGGGRL